MTTSRGQQVLLKLVQQLSELDPAEARSIRADLGFVENVETDALTLSHAVKQLSAMDPTIARNLIDNFSDSDVAAALSACSEARVAQDGEDARDAFDESVAARLQSKAVAA